MVDSLERISRGPVLRPCPRCLAPLKPSACFCFNCGARTADPVEGKKEGRWIDGVRGVYCPWCGRFNAFKDTFRCLGCWESTLCLEHRAGEGGSLCQRCRRSLEEGRPLDQSPGSSPELAPDQIRGPGSEIQGRHWEEMEEAEGLRKEEPRRGNLPGSREAGLGSMVSVPGSQEAGARGMIWVPAGELLMGDDRRRVYVEGFAIDPFPVTHLQFQRFLPQHRFPPGQANHPAVKMSWYEAVAYAHWAGKRLPTEAEWEKAARGTDGRLYPWGDRFDPGRCNTLEGQVREVTPVDRYPTGRSPYGCYDMAGNVVEWTEDWYDPERNFKVIKGCCWVDHDLMARCANRAGLEPLHRFGLIGFRCAW